MTITVREFVVLDPASDLSELTLRGSREELLGLLIDVATPARPTPAHAVKWAACPVKPVDESGQSSGFSAGEEEEEIKAGDWVKFRADQHAYAGAIKVDPAKAHKVEKVFYGYAYISPDNKTAHVWRLRKVPAPAAYIIYDRKDGQGVRRSFNLAGYTYDTIKNAVRFSSEDNARGFVEKVGRSYLLDPEFSRWQIRPVDNEGNLI